jgi:hypothetical protein
VRLERRHHGRVHRDPHGEQEVLAVERPQRAGPGPRERAAGVPQLHHHQRAARPAEVEEGVGRLGGQRVEHRGRAQPGHGVLGIHVDVAQAGRRDHREGVHLGLQGPQRREHLAGERLVAGAGAVDHDDGAPAQEVGQLGHRRHVHDPQRRGDRVGRARGPLAPRVHDVVGALDRPQQHPA